MSKIQISKSFLPNTFTFINLSLGIFSLLMTFKSNYVISSLAILCAALIDRYDGKIARFFNASSEIGKELDSLADLVSFGVAPSMLLYFLYEFNSFGILGYILLITFPIAGAYRLAKFNIVSFDNIYTGIPITVAGSVVAFYSLVTSKTPCTLIITIPIFLLLAYLMVSKLKFKKF